MLSGLEASVAAFEISNCLVHMICVLFEQGFGGKMEEDESGDGDGAKNEFTSGTGMGEGDGAKDVTEEIEDDAQLEGTKGDEGDNKEPPEVPQPKEDNAREVGFDLDTEAQAVPEDKDAD